MVKLTDRRFAHGQDGDRSRREINLFTGGVLSSVRPFFCIFAKRAMRSEIDMYKGIRPGKIVGLELQERNLSQRAFAAAIDEHKQTLNAVITGRRKLTVEMALKIEKALGYDEGFLLTLQAYYEIAEYKNRKANESVRGAPAIRRMLFWDTDFDKIDWGRSKESILERVMERGDENEKQEIARFYGMDRAELERYKPDLSYRIPYKYRHKQ